VNEVGTLKKGIDILWLIIERGSLSVLEMMEILSLNRSTTYRLVNTLEQNHLIQKTDEGTYEVSRRLIDKQNDHSFNFDLDSIILRYSDEFQGLTGETIFVGVLNEDHVMATHIIPGKFPTRTHYEKGEKLSVYQSAVGKCILAFQAADVQADFTSLQEDTDSFLAELDQIKGIGYALDNEQAEAGVRCISAPIWRNGRVVAGIAITGPSARVSQAMDGENGKLVVQFSQRITERLNN
jgi:IclR family KDG regulon transcriptional repressor